MSETNAVKSLNLQQQLLQLEYENEKKEFSELREKAGLDRLLSSGKALTGIKLINSHYNSFNQKVLEISFSAQEDDDNNNFEYGVPVIFFGFDNNKAFKLNNLFSGEISYVDGNRMGIIVSDSIRIDKLYSYPDIGIMVSFDETTYKVMFEALNRTINASGRQAELRDLIYSGKESGIWKLPYSFFPYLNKDQEEAVNKILSAKDIAIVHGPPGTGKTTTLVEAIYETLRKEPQVLVCAQSNLAVDWISEKLIERGINVLRLGNPTRVNDNMLSFTYERQFENHPDYPELWKLRNLIRHIRSSKNLENRHQKLDRLKSKATEIEIRINNDLLNNAKVIASTLVGSSHRLLAGLKFSTLFIDEAAQALEAATWIPIRKAGRVILAGDHCQLPPVIKSYEAMKGGLGISLMERIVKNHPSSVKMLTCQYRMNEEIMNFSNRWFYNGNMKASPEVRFRGILDFDTPVEWVDTSEEVATKYVQEEDQDLGFTFKEQVTETQGKINKGEARLLIKVLKDYIEKIGIARFVEENINFGIISPYRLQVQYLRKLIKKDSFFKPVKKLISINTVDGFQGQERDVIVISMVRNNDSGNIGFLNDLRRMNVAMTRARMKLIIIGNKETLSRNKFYQSLYSYCQKI